MTKNYAYKVCRIEESGFHSAYVNRKSVQHRYKLGQRTTIFPSLRFVSAGLAVFTDLNESINWVLKQKERGNIYNFLIFKVECSKFKSDLFRDLYFRINNRHHITLHNITNIDDVRWKFTVNRKWPKNTAFVDWVKPIKVEYINVVKQNELGVINKGEFVHDPTNPLGLE